MGRSDLELTAPLEDSGRSARVESLEVKVPGMGEILSHAEVEAILAAIEPLQPNEPSTPVDRPPSAVTLGDPLPWERHDFRPPDTLPGAALKVIHALHEGVCQRWKDRLEVLLQARVEIRSVGACHSATSEFLSSLNSSHVICQVSHDKSAADSCLVWSTELVQSLIAKMLGGGDGQVAETSAQPMTNIELRLLARLNDAVLREVATLLGDSLSVVAVLQSVQAVPERIAKFPAVWFSFDMDCCGVRGLIHLGIPGVSVRSSEDSSVARDDVRNELTAQSIPAGIQQVSVQVCASLASLKLKTSDLIALQVGDIVMTDLSPSDSVSLQLDGRALCQATIGTHLGRKALRLAESTEK